MSETKKLTDKYIMNTYSRQPIVFEKGEGVYLYDENGKKYLDFMAGIAVNCLGYANEKIINAITKQVKLLSHCSNIYYSMPQAKVAELLVENSCFDRVFFCNSGAEAVEAALKLAKKYGNNFETPKTKIISMKNSFHGRTMGALSLTGQTKYQRDFEPVIANVSYAEYNNIDSVKSLIDEQVCAIIAEPIQGEGGLKPGDTAFLKELRKICDENNIVLIFDEVQTGIGRTGKLFAYENFDVEPDVICLAKGLGNGIPIGAMMARANFADVLVAGNHASTFGGNPIATACANVVLDELLNKNILDNVNEVGEYLKNRLQDLQKKYDFITDIRGKGLMLGVECSVDIQKILEDCRENGLLLISAGGNVIRMVPPLIISKSQIDEAIEILEKVLKRGNICQEI